MTNAGQRLRAGGAALVAVAMLAIPPAAGEKPPRPPKPKLELLTETQEAVLRNDAVRVEIRSKRGDEARVKAGLVVEGFPEDYSFRLGPESRRLRHGETRARLELSARQREVLAFAEQACDGATLKIHGRAARKSVTLSTPLPSKGC